MDKNTLPTPVQLGSASTGQGGRSPGGRDPEDLEWLDYLATLPPKGVRGAFLLVSELPDWRSSPRAVLEAIGRASRRAFETEKPIEFTDFEAGRLWGTMRVLLPQGREIREDFAAEPGWKAVAILGQGYDARPITTYYRQQCMNPLRVNSQTEAIVDNSDVIFAPIGRDLPEMISPSPAVDSLVASSLARLSIQYHSVRNSWQGGFLRRLLQLIFRVR